MESEPMPSDKASRSAGGRAGPSGGDPHGAGSLGDGRPTSAGANREAPARPATDRTDGLAAGSARLRLYQLVSPALPVGAFSYSEGLEVLVQAGRLGDASAVQSWLEAELQRGALRLEAAALPSLMALLRDWQERAGRGDSEAEEARQRLLERDGWLLAQREAAEMRAQQRQMGGSLLQLLADLGWPLPGPATLAWPTGFAWAGHCLAVPAEALVEAYLYGWVANQLSAAVRLVPLGPTEAQRLQLRLGPVIAAQAAALATSDPETLWNGGVGAGLAQLSHSGLYSRLFRS
jgi:urease accessory protein